LLIAGLLLFNDSAPLQPQTILSVEDCELHSGRSPLDKVQPAVARARITIFTYRNRSFNLFNPSLSLRDAALEMFELFNQFRSLNDGFCSRILQTPSDSGYRLARAMCEQDPTKVRDERWEKEFSGTQRNVPNVALATEFILSLVYHRARNVDGSPAPWKENAC